MGEVIRCMRVNLVSPNVVTHMIEPSATFYYFHPDCYDRWSKRQFRTGLLSFTMAELEIDSDNVLGVTCHSCNQLITRETIVL